jgi:predicted dehydrogenase
MADVVVVGSTTAERSGLVPLVVVAGCPALVEEPLGVSTAQTVELASLIDDAVAPVSTAMFLRCAPALLRVRSLLAGGALGELAAAYAEFGHHGLLDGVSEDSEAWMLDPDHGGTGAFAHLGIHVLDSLQWLRPGARLTVRSARLRYRPGRPLTSAVRLSWAGATWPPAFMRDGPRARRRPPAH